MGAIPQAMQPRGFWGSVRSWFMDRRNTKALDSTFVRLDVKPTDSILEIGFGSGRLLRTIAKTAREGFVAGVDPSELMLHKAEQRIWRFRRHRRVELKWGDASALPWADGTFDKVAALHCFHFWEDPARGISEVRRVLKPGGLFVLVLRHRQRKGPKWLPNPISRAGDEVMGAYQLIAAAGFTQARIEGAAGTSPMITAVRA
jgi:ubiquinone/menaquinone biosynthesis C-methylase UbiE